MYVMRLKIKHLLRVALSAVVLTALGGCTDAYDPLGDLRPSSQPGNWNGPGGNPDPDNGGDTSFGSEGYGSDENWDEGDQSSGSQIGSEGYGSDEDWNSGSQGSGSQIGSEGYGSDEDWN